MVLAVTGATTTDLVKIAEIRENNEQTVSQI